jgi:hypothetical protein
MNLQQVTRGNRFARHLVVLRDEFRSGETCALRVAASLARRPTVLEIAALTHRSVTRVESALHRLRAAIEHELERLHQTREALLHAAIATLDSALDRRVAHLRLQLDDRTYRPALEHGTRSPETCNR